LHHHVVLFGASAIQNHSPMRDLPIRFRFTLR